MAFQGFMAGPSGHGLTTSWFIFSGYFLNADKVYVTADIVNDNCDFDRIEWDTKNTSSFLVHLKNIARKHISEKVTYKFNLIYTTKDDKMYQQIVKYNGECTVSAPEEITVNDGGVNLS